jgi:hypothetical protein
MEPVVFICGSRSDKISTPVLNPTQPVRFKTGQYIQIVFQEVCFIYELLLTTVS